MRDKKIFGAGLDVYSSAFQAPSDDNLLVTGHMINLDEGLIDDIASLCVKNVIRVLNGKKAVTPVAENK